jgi:hypothetical protein
MKPTILKHCAGRGYNSPLMQEDKEKKNAITLSGSHTAQGGTQMDEAKNNSNLKIGYNRGDNFGLNLGGEFDSVQGKTFGAGANWMSKGGGVSAGVDYSKNMDSQLSNINGSLRLRF